jgi:hypothetical protein
MFKHAEPIPSIPLTPENLTQVSSKTDLLAMIDVLKTTKEIAVDLEHHSYRTYAGFLCLMQISTRERDYIVDLLIPDVRAELAALGEVFADPSIVKVKLTARRPSSGTHENTRSSMVQTVILSGYNRIFVCILSICSTPFMHQKYLVSSTTSLVSV